ncbi:MAG: hypothetical protein ACR2OZ_01940 [Verrucomicrobiales bacterium]
MTQRKPTFRFLSRRVLAPAWWRRVVVVACVMGGGMDAAPRKAAAPENLVPANMQPVQDDKGNQWSINNYGFLQNTGNSFFNNILMLHIGGQQFYNYQPLMTPDGKEFVLPGQQPLLGLQVTRRVRLLEKDGAMRYVDLFHNPGSAPVIAAVEYRNNFSNPVKTAVSDRGVTNPGALTKNETSLLITSKQQGQKAVLFTLSSSASKNKPSFGKRSQFEWNFSYTLSVPAGQTVALCYTIALVPPINETDKAAMEKLFKAAAGSRFLKTVRREDLPLLVNFNHGTGVGPAALLASGGLETLDVERAKSDVLAMGDKTRLFGTASCGEFSVATKFGTAVIPFEQVAALVGGPRSGAGGTRVYLRDGQLLSGQVKATDFRFVMPSGARVDLDLATMDRLVRGATAEEGKWAPETAALLATFSGDQVALAANDAAVFQCTTSWGPVRFSLDDILWLGPTDEGAVGHHIEFKDGSRFFGFLSGPEVLLRTRLFAEKTFPPGHIRALVTSGALAKSREESAEPRALEQPHVLLAGGQRLLGQIEAEALTVLTSIKAIQIPPQSIRTLRNAREESEPGGSEDTPPFQIELWGGGTILGQLKDPVVPIRVRDAVWRVPVDDLVEFNTPTPHVSDETRIKIAALVRELGSDEWEKREAASAALAEFGFMAKSVLEETLKTSPDPEVQRRVEKLLDDFQ